MAYDWSGKVVLLCVRGAVWLRNYCTYLNCALCWLLGERYTRLLVALLSIGLSNSSRSVSHVSWKPETVVNKQTVSRKFKISAIISKRFRFRLHHAFSQLFRLFFFFELHLTEMSSNMINVLKGARHLTSTVKQAGNYYTFWGSNIPQKLEMKLNCDK